MRTRILNSFFAGIGGFDLGFERAGIETAFQCEINPFCQSILDQHWPGVPRASDINELESAEIPPADVWAAGFPCQDISLARGSERLGLKGSRSGLFYRFAELVADRLPTVVLLENVPGLLSSNTGNDFHVILQTLTGLGYAVGWRALNSRYFGVPQSRERIFIVGWRNDPGAVARVLFDPVVTPPISKPRAGFIESADDLKTVDGPIVPKVAFCLAATSGRHTGTDWSRTYVAYTDRVRRLTPVEYERLQGFPDEWTHPQADRFGQPDEVDSLRYSALGNAVTVSVIEWLASRIKEAFVAPRELQDGILSLFDQHENSVVNMLSAAAPEFSRSGNVVVPIPETEEHSTLCRWPNAGMAFGKTVVAARIPPRPITVLETSLGNIVEKTEVDRRYFLSPNAAAGIIRRVKQQKRTLFAPLDTALHRLVAANIMEDEVLFLEG